MAEKFDRFNSQELVKDEGSLKLLANWWGNRLVAKKEELRNLPFYNAVSGKHGLNFPFYALVTHHCSDEQAKRGIFELGGVIGMPGIYTVAYGQTATDQILHSLGERKDGFGKPHDGLTFVYLHSVGYELLDACRNYFESLEPNIFGIMFGNREDRDPRKHEFQIEKIIQSPWEGLTVDLTEGDGPAKLKRVLTRLEGIDLNAPNFQYRLKRLENKFLLANL